MFLPVFLKNIGQVYEFLENYFLKKISSESSSDPRELEQVELW